MQYSQALYIGQLINLTPVKLLQSAAEYVGGEKQLTVQLDIAQSLLDIADRYHVPDARSEDIVVAYRQSLTQLTTTQTSVFEGI